MLNNTDRIVKLYEELYVGKEAVYKSKYGHTRGIIIERVHVCNNFIPDKDYDYASQLEINFISTKGNLYKLNELFFCKP